MNKLQGALLKWALSKRNSSNKIFSLDFHGIRTKPISIMKSNILLLVYISGASASDGGRNFYELPIRILFGLQSTTGILPPPLRTVNIFFF